EPVTVFGFPLAGVLASDGVVATGTVAALAGPGDDPGLFPIQAPVQPGNSGGPVVDAHGLVVSWAWSWASSMP
ncbi:MAG: trypsin-like peptidase domain-containing protein, partial [Geminicoccaceae bacterium]|nr:trypsin-like peptidase domain-containing protein [Geminicoccaceae bacterium]